MVKNNDQAAHDVFEGEIPKDIGKKSLPLWLKGIGLAGLVGVLGIAVYMLESGGSVNGAIESSQNNIAQALSGHVPYTDDTGATVEPIEPPSPNAEIAIEIADAITVQPEQLSTSEIDLIAFDDPEAAITITPPAEPMAQSPTIVRSELADSELREEVTKLTSRLDEVESAQSERITVVKSGIELQTQSMAKLAALVSSLEGLKKELGALRNAPVSQPTYSKQTTKQTNKPNTTAKPVKIEKKPELSLIGIDTWGGERFAQIEYEGQIHLLAVNESVADWRIHDIARESVVVKNKEGNSFELDI